MAGLENNPATRRWVSLRWDGPGVAKGVPSEELQRLEGRPGIQIVTSPEGLTVVTAMGSTQYAGSDIGVPKYVHQLDSLGRAVRTEQGEVGSSRLSFACEWTYDEAGRVATVTEHRHRLERGEEGIYPWVETRYEYPVDGSDDRYTRVTRVIETGEIERETWEQRMRRPRGL